MSSEDKSALLSIYRASFHFVAFDPTALLNALWKRVYQCFISVWLLLSYDDCYFLFLFLSLNFVTGNRESLVEIDTRIAVWLRICVEFDYSDQCRVEFYSFLTSFALQTMKSARMRWIWMEAIIINHSSVWRIHCLNVGDSKATQKRPWGAVHEHFVQL